MSEKANRSPGIDRQIQTYLAGAQGIRPEHPFSFFDLEQKARDVMDPDAWGYVEPGAGAGDTVFSNQEAFLEWEIVPRALRDVSSCDLKVDLLGLSLRSPLVLAPIGIQEILHQEAEIGSGRAAASLMMPFVLSAVSSRSIEQVAEAMGPMPRWFQLYWGSRNDIVISLLERAERSGYSAIVLTVDAKLLGWRDADLQNAYLPVVQGKGVANFFTDPEFRRTLDQPPEEDPHQAIQQLLQVLSNLTLSWDDVRWLVDQTSLPVLLKGILHPDDAKRAVDSGAAGVIVSNHGGRQVDGAVGALRALPGISEALDDAATILFDSGIRRASHIVKALCLGASAVLVGRPYIYGLALNGEQGVRDVMLNLLGELDVTMRLSGYRSLGELTRECLRAV
ncbi:MAG: alpha-hydroxy-acid oxidizing protein [Rhodothermia bacterium]|nr:alpha-hydroxy-acid oxidizing protein [Rhodothermia bacterium]